jgi:hypothetical protein
MCVMRDRDAVEIIYKPPPRDLRECSQKNAIDKVARLQSPSLTLL